MTRIKRIITTTLALITFSSLYAGQNERVSGTYTYIGQGYESRDVCRKKAYKGACVEAVGNKFGWIVSGTTSQVESFIHGKEDLFFQQEHRRVARGEWIADDGEPVYEYAFDSEGCLTVKCTVNGFARKLSNERLEFEAIPLRNGTDRSAATEQFRSGDSFRLLMHAPADGYTAVFLIGEDNTVNTLIPYSEASADAVRINGGSDIVLFDPAFVKEPERHLVDELRLTADSELDHYRLCVVYSPNRFVKPNDASIGTLIPRQLKLTDFNQWLQRISDTDKRISIKNIGLTVVP